MLLDLGERNNYESLQPRFLPRYEFDGETFEINDPVWGAEVIGHEPHDEVLLELLHNPLVRRSMAIEQLTLDALTATIPDTTSFSRWEHIWGSVAFVRKMTNDVAMDPRERMVLQLRTFVSDLGHTAYSHLGDWMFQGSGGTEDQHDNELLYLLEVSGATDTIRRHGFTPDEVVFPDTQDWIENKSPELCVDRVDYGAREIKRWLNVTQGVHRTVRPDAFQLRDGQLVMSDKQAALSFAKAFLLLSTEHWSEPVHRLQLRLQEELVKSVIGNDHTHLIATDSLDVGSYHPRETLYTVDGDITRETYLFGTFRAVTRSMMQEIGLSKRRIFAHEKLGQLTLFMADDETQKFPNPLKHYDYFAKREGKEPLLPANISMVPVKGQHDMTDFNKNRHRLDFYLPALKPRQIDPLFIDEGGDTVRLSLASPEFQQLARRQSKLMQRSYVAQLHVNPETARIVRKGIKENQVTWRKALQRPHMPEEAMKRMLHNSVGVAAGYRMIDLSWRD
jgi:hypothetical protein